jgi:hypothetical protein
VPPDLALKIDPPTESEQKIMLAHFGWVKVGSGKLGRIWRTFEARI